MKTYKEYSFYVNPEKVKSIKIHNDIYGLDVAQLMIRILPLDNLTAYLIFPDGGNMFVLTGGGIDSDKLVLSLNGILMKKGYTFVKVLGWKPRIDWLVIPSTFREEVPIVEKLEEKFDIKEIHEDWISGRRYLRMTEENSDEQKDEAIDFPLPSEITLI